MKVNSSNRMKMSRLRFLLRYRKYRSAIELTELFKFSFEEKLDCRNLSKNIGRITRSNWSSK